MLRSELGVTMQDGTVMNTPSFSERLHVLPPVAYEATRVPLSLYVTAISFNLFYSSRKS